MPIYAYRCAECGATKDVLQKLSDPLLTICPVCGKPAMQKQVTAAGFQLKGTGWYATDFKGGSGGTSAPATEHSHSDSAAPAASPAPSAPATAAPASTDK